MVCTLVAAACCKRTSRRTAQPRAYFCITTVALRSCWYLRYADTHLKAVCSCTRLRIMAQRSLRATRPRCSFWVTMQDLRSLTNLERCKYMRPTDCILTSWLTVNR